MACSRFGSTGMMPHQEARNLQGAGEQAGLIPLWYLIPALVAPLVVTWAK